MKANKLLIILLLIVLISGCTEKNSITGRYQSTEDPGAYLELKDDGRYIVTQEQAFSGDYTVNDDSIILIYTFGSFKLTQDGSTLTDEDGEEWVKS